MLKDTAHQFKSLSKGCRCRKLILKLWPPGIKLGAFAARQVDKHICTLLELKSWFQATTNSKSHFLY